MEVRVKEFREVTGIDCQHFFVNSCPALTKKAQASYYERAHGFSAITKLLECIRHCDDIPVDELVYKKAEKVISLGRWKRRGSFFPTGAQGEIAALKEIE